MSAAPTGSGVEDLVTQIVADALGRGIDEVRDHPNLLELPGFDSVLIVETLDRLEDELRVEVPPERIVPEAFTSVDTLARLLSDAEPSGKGSS